MGSQPGIDLPGGLSVYIVRYCRSNNVNNPLHLANLEFLTLMLKLKGH